MLAQLRKPLLKRLNARERHESNIEKEIPTSYWAKPPLAKPHTLGKPQTVGEIRLFSN